MPLRCCRKLSATRSRVSSVRALPRTVAISCPARSNAPLSAFSSMSLVNQRQQLDSRDHYWLANDEAAVALAGRRERTDSVVTSPEPMSSSRARSTSSAGVIADCSMRCALFELCNVFAALGPQRIHHVGRSAIQEFLVAKVGGHYRRSAFPIARFLSSSCRAGLRHPLPEAAAEDRTRAWNGRRRRALAELPFGCRASHSRASQ